MTDKETFDALINLISLKIPGFEIGYKDENLVSKILGVLVWPFNRQYMTQYATTRYPKVFFPSRKWVEANYRLAWKVLAHEFVHLWDRQQEGASFNVKYASPQMWAVTALIALIAIWVGPWGLLGLIPLLLLLPWPSPGRRDKELRGYTMSMALNHWRYGGEVRESTKNWIAKQFTGSFYYFMWPFHGSVYAMLDEASRDLDDDNILDWKNAETFVWVRELLGSA
jgi:hypothetical protein